MRKKEKIRAQEKVLPRASTRGGLHVSSQSSPNVKTFGSKKVAFVSIKNATQRVKSISQSTANVKAFHYVESESKESNNDKGDNTCQSTHRCYCNG